MPFLFWKYEMGFTPRSATSLHTHKWVGLWTVACRRRSLISSPVSGLRSRVISGAIYPAAESLLYVVSSLSQNGIEDLQERRDGVRSSLNGRQSPCEETLMIYIHENCNKLTLKTAA
jgi:hypothetical protein